MQTVEIPRREWQSYFDHLNKLYEGWAVTIEMLEGELGDQRFTDGLPLQAISLETKGSACGDILVEAGDAEPALNTHRVSRPARCAKWTADPGMRRTFRLSPTMAASSSCDCDACPNCPRPEASNASLP